MREPQTRKTETQPAVIAAMIQVSWFAMSKHWINQGVLDGWIDLICWLISATIRVVFVCCLARKCMGAGLAGVFLHNIMSDGEVPVEPAWVRRRPDEQEFVRHICDVLASKMARDGLDLDGHELGCIVRPKLREFFWVRSVDAMEWVIRCGVGDREFEQDKEDEIPVLCRYYNDYITQGEWSEQDHTMMMVLNRYDKIKAGKYGNFAGVPARPLDA